jgi:2-oxo-4-hydroxy-4-carboxy--5-ureidoimidazoline (OHCU) decarboxylase
LNNAKRELAQNFVSSLKKKDMHSLWQARKAFDQQIERSFTGAPTLQNSIKREFRNAVQDYISEKTPDTIYKGYMGDMTELFKMRDVLTTKAAKERTYSGIVKWYKHNPIKAKILGATLGAGALGAIGSNLGGD